MERDQIMKQLEGLVNYPWAVPNKRMVNGEFISDSESDEESRAKKSKKATLPAVDEHKKIALVIDTNVLLKQT